jgi:hypothetical protein
MNKKIFTILIVCVVILLAPPCLAKRNIIPVSGKVNSFGTYSFIPKFNFEIKEPKEQDLGIITVQGTYNGEYPWIMRIYTDNTNYTGIATAARPQSPAGLISTDGRFSLPLKINIPNFGVEQYKTVPDINQPGYKPYTPAKLNGSITNYTDCVIMAIDPRNEMWVAGEDGVLFDNDDNTLGDITMETPFDIKFRTECDERAVAANYTANLYIEIVACP